MDLNFHWAQALSKAPRPRSPLLWEKQEKAGITGLHVTVDTVLRQVGIVKRNHEREAGVALHVGPIPKTDRVCESELKSLGAMSCFANPDGATLHVRWMTFREPTEGVPTFADWLCGQGGSDIQYRFHSDTAPIDSSDSEEQQSQNT